MASIYSTKLAEVSVTTGGPYTVYTAPSGATVVVRCITAAIYVAGASVAYFSIGGSYPLCGVSESVAFVSTPVNMRHVLNPGDTIVVSNVTGDWLALISGYVLLN